MEIQSQGDLLRELDFHLIEELVQFLLGPGHRGGVERPAGLDPVGLPGEGHGVRRSSSR